MKVRFRRDYREISNTFDELGCRRGPIPSRRWRTLIHNHPAYELGNLRNLTHMFDDIFIAQYSEQTFFEYKYSATYKCPEPRCLNHNTEIIGDNLTISIRCPSAEGVIDLTQNLANETNNICAQGRYRCARCQSRIRTENISTINSVQLPCMIVVELLNFHRQNQIHIRRTKTPINSTVILGNREYKLVGAAYFGNSHYCSLRIHTDNRIYENNGMIKDGEDRVTRLTSMPYSFEFRQDVQRPATYEVEVAFYVLQPEIHQDI